MNLSNIKTVLLFLINIYSIMKTAQFRKRIIFNIFGIALYRAGSCPSGRSMPPNLSLIHSLAWGTSVYRVSVRVTKVSSNNDKGAATT